MVIMCLLIATVVGCVKRRDDIYAPQISDPSEFISLTDAIKNIDNKSGFSERHSLETDDYASRGNSVDAQNIRLNKPGFNLPLYVNLKTNVPLLKDHLDKIKMFGLPNSKYDLYYEFSPKYLTIYKVTPADQITHYETSISKKNEKGLWLVPLGGYEVSYYQKYKVPDSDNRATNIISYKEVSANNYKTMATHFRYNSERFIPFYRIEKTNIYPANYFNGEWYFATTIVATKPGEESNLGYFDSSMDASLRKIATRIKFIRSREFLRAVNTVVDSRLKVSDEQLDDVINIPATWLDFRRVKSKDYEELSEEINSTTDFNNRSYVQLDFKLVKSLIVEDESKLDAYFKGIELSDINFGKDSFSFTLLRISTGVKRKYSFQRILSGNNTYKPKIYTLDDQKIYGYFSTKLERLIDLGVQRRRDYERDFLANRFNPNKDIVFRFSKQTPRAGEVDVYGLRIDYRKIGKNAVSYWNQAFEFFGAKNNIVLDESLENELGDFDSNTINIITNLAADGSGGVGPTISDPLSGEIINGTVNVYAATTISNLNTDLRDLLRVERGLIVDTIFPKNLRERGIKSGFKKEVEIFCPEVINYAKKTKGQMLNESSEENKVVFSCLEKIAPKRIEAIVVHEMGHTLGLRHNFYGSFDEKNSFKSISDLNRVYPKVKFPDLYSQNLPKDNESMLLRYSSVMDYFNVWFSSDEGMSLPVPSMYDIAALAYLYMNKVPKEGDSIFNGFIVLDADKDIGENKIAGHKNIRTMLYCSDEQALNRAKPPQIIDSACALHDKGQSYSEVMDYYFNIFKDELLILSKKMDRVSLRSSADYLNSKVTAMAVVYMDWRYKLSRLMNDPTNTRLMGYNTQKFNELLDRVEKSESPIKKDKELSRKFYDYLLAIQDIPNYYCVTVNKNKDINIYEFARLQKKLVSQTIDNKISSCEDDIIKKYLSATNEVVLGELGLPINSIQFSQSVEDAKESFDIMGVENIRLHAVMHFGELKPLLYFNKLNNFLPSVLDEPQIYEAYKRKTEDRILNGLDIVDQLNYAFHNWNLNFEIPRNQKFKKFIEENKIYDASFVTMVNSNLGSDSSGSKRDRLNDFEIGSTTNLAEISPNAKSVKIGNAYYYSLPQNRWSFELIKKYREIKNPADIDVSVINPGLKPVLDTLIPSIEDLPYIADDNFVINQNSLITFMQKTTGVFRANQSNEHLINEIGVAYKNYLNGLENVNGLYRSEQLKNTTGQLNFDFMGEKVSYQKISNFVERIRENGMDLKLARELGFLAPLTQEAFVSNYLNTKDLNAYNYWRAKFSENTKELNGFEPEELTVYKAYLENRISK